MNRRIILLEDNFVHRKRIQKVCHSILEIHNIAYQVIPIDDPYNFYMKIDTIELSFQDIFVIDIDLNTYCSGIDIAEKIRKKNPHVNILFVTANEEHCMEVVNRAIRPTGYIVKQDIDNEDFEEMVKHKLTWVLKEILAKITQGNTIQFEYGASTIVIGHNEINYLETIKGKRNLVKIYKTNGEQIIIRGSISKIRKKIDVSYFFCNFKSLIINGFNIEKIERTKECITFKNKDELFVGKKIIDQVRSNMQQVFFQII